jgi:ABC-type multidrug transport system permease subunit
MTVPFRYARYQAWDAIVHRLSLPLILIAILSALPAYMMARNSPADFLRGPQGTAFATQLYTQSTTLFLPLGAFMCAVGVASADRHHGYFRLLFAKPVSVVAYYCQSYLVAGIAFTLVFGLVTWGVGAMTIHFSVHRGMEAAALTWVLIGGIGMLLGALTRFDAAALIALYVLALLLQQIMATPNGLAHGGLPGWLAAIGAVLPPVKRLDVLRDQLYAAQALDLRQLAYVVGYGAAAWVAGVILLVRRPIAR